jgi:flagellar L-ring protein precursor FlgH
LAIAALAAEKKKEEPAASPLDEYVREAAANAARNAVLTATPGSTWRTGGMLSDLARDLRANQVDDLVTIVVDERASAVAKGTTKTSRSSAANASISAAWGLTRAAGPLANLAGASGSHSLAGDGATTRENVLSATVSARVAGVLPNGYLVLEGVKHVVVNSESQVIVVRGVARPADIAPGNTIRSDRLAQLEVRINGKGVVGDAIRRPNFLYRLLLGLLPF